MDDKVIVKNVDTQDVGSQNDGQQNQNTFEKKSERPEVSSPMDMLFKDYLGDNGNSEDIKKDEKEVTNEDDENVSEGASKPEVEDSKPTESENEDDIDTILKSLEESAKDEEAEITVSPKVIEKFKNIVKNASEAEELRSKIKELESKVSKWSSTEKEFIEAFRRDPKSAVSKYAESLKLPDPDVVNTMLSSDSVEDQLTVWQENVLVKEIEKEFNLQPGEFEIDKEELWTPKTPSYKWRVESEKKERELTQQLESTAQKAIKQKEEFFQRQQRDKDWIKDTYFKDNEEAFKQIVEEAMSVPEKVFSGELPPEASPFEYRNLIRGMFFDKFVQIEVEKAVSELKKQYESLGYSLPAHDNPTDVTNIKGEKVEKDNAPKETFSPLHNTMSKYLS